MRNFTLGSQPSSPYLQWFSKKLISTFSEHGFCYKDEAVDPLQLVFHFITEDDIKPFRRKAQATFVVSILESHGKPYDLFTEVYPFLIRSLANHFIYVNHQSGKTTLHFLTPEQGCYSIEYREGDDVELFFTKVYKRLQPLTCSQLVIDNHYSEDLPADLWAGDRITRSLSTSGKKLDELNLLPAPFPLEHYLSKRDLRHLQKLYGLGGLSYGNLSARCDDEHFWMSASGIDKSNMTEIGRDMLYIKGYNEENNHIEVSIPPNIQPKRASVDAIEHWMIYKEHPKVGAIVHIHAWMDGIEATEINYPCGTIELAETVASLVRQAEKPEEAVIGLKNHGLTITGTSLENIFDRIEGKIQNQVPMS
ncbi:class II aldolase/adducin family protein [Halalkalibacter urbisdiaboli]|uniref:class II aldolase/adducin family protein n=1 Tax=Halalkalibacter urbisdiaboli TaxID=1960589 RepID=UPI000B43416D|nr:class II aldolase/adducin family protein [Halalkalibacter urbisdiaboli]